MMKELFHTFSSLLKASYISSPILTFCCSSLSHTSCQRERERELPYLLTIKTTLIGVSNIWITMNELCLWRPVPPPVIWIPFTPTFLRILLLQLPHHPASLLPDLPIRVPLSAYKYSEIPPILNKPPLTPKLPPELLYCINSQKNLSTVLVPTSSLSHFTFTSLPTLMQFWLPSSRSLMISMFPILI